MRKRALDDGVLDSNEQKLGYEIIKVTYFSGTISLFIYESLSISSYFTFITHTLTYIHCNFKTGKFNPPNISEES